MKAKLTLVETKHEKSPLRTESVYGVLPNAPTVGAAILMYAEPLVEGNCRVIQTSVVQKIRDIGDGKKLIFTTNSIYELTEFEGFDND